MATLTYHLDPQMEASMTQEAPVARVTAALRLEWLVDNETAHKLAGANLYAAPPVPVLSDDWLSQAMHKADMYRWATTAAGINDLRADLKQFLAAAMVAAQA
jgi:hypothetical protein